MNLVSVDLLRNTFYVALKSATSNYMYSVRKFSRVSKGTGRVIWLTRVTAAPRDYCMEGARLGRSVVLDSSIWLKVFRNIMLENCLHQQGLNWA
jgi:hypothetical protein